jgi:hypothetical protein
MEHAGGASWATWKAEAQAQGLPIIPGEELEGLKTHKSTSGSGVRSAFKKPVPKGQDVSTTTEEVTKTDSPNSDMEKLLEVLETAVPVKPKLGPGAVLP